MMTYIQEEMTSQMRYQMSKEDNIPFFISARYRVTDLFEIESEFGFRHFNSVSKYVRSWYPDTGFFSLGIVFSNFKSYFMRRWVERISLTYSYVPFFLNLLGILFEKD
jgi:hypothetical protein